MKRREEVFVVGAILGLGMVLRVLWNDVPEYSRADERIYVETTRFLFLHGWADYPTVVARFLADSSQWVYPPPLRWGFYALTTGACHLDHNCNERTLAWLSTLAGGASVLLTYLLGKRLISRKVGLVAAALSLTSPLQLAMGRRALTDEVFCAAVLLLLLCVVPMVSAAASWRRYALAILVLTFIFSVKETALLLYPPLLVVLVDAVRRRGWKRQDLLLLGLPPILYFAGFALAAHGLNDFFPVASATASTMSAPYPAQYQSGPPHRIALDLFTLAPIVCLLAAAGLGLRESGTRTVTLLSLSLLLIFAGVTSKNVRYAIMLDPLLRLLAAGVLLRARPVWMAATLVVNGVFELWLFHTVFIVGRVYDPVTANLMHALGAAP